MDDRRTPMEAEIQELPAQDGLCRAEDYYGTSTRPQTRRVHTGLWILLGLTVMALCTVGVVAALGHIRVDREAGGWRLSMRTTNYDDTQEDMVRELPVSVGNKTVPGSAEPQTSLGLMLRQGSGETLAPEQIYQNTAPAVVCVEEETYYGTSCNTGVVISSDGYILSASEGLSDSAALRVTFFDGSSYSARRVGEERKSGVCLLKVEAEGLETVAFSDGKDLAVGQRTYCICNPYGSEIRNVFYEGMLSARRTISFGGGTCSVLQSSAQLMNVGWGCPILDTSGRVVGLTSPVGSRLGTGTEEAALAISTEELVRLVQALEQTQAESGCWLGLEVEEIPEEYLYFYGFPGDLWITDVSVGSAPYGVLKQYDVITAVDGVPVTTVEAFEQAVSAHAPGDVVVLTIYRSGQWYRSPLPVVNR